MRMNMVMVLMVFFIVFGAVWGRAIEEKGDIAIELKIDDFNNTLWAAPESWAIVEFFAHWCPACRNYKPQYEKVARLFNGRDAVHPGIILMAKVDCALKVNTKLCERFSVSHYPMLLWGKPSKFAFGSWDSKPEGGIEQIDSARTAELLLNWINKKIGMSFTLHDEKFTNEGPISNSSSPVEIARAIYDIEEATALILDFFPVKINADSRVSLIKFLQVVSVHHPSKRCRRGSTEILVDFDELWPSTLWSAENKKEWTSVRDVFQKLHLCGKKVPRGYWLFCRGSKNDTRGFSCGLWLLFHSLSVRTEDGESMGTFTTICDFVRNFFICEECRQHFSKMCSSVHKPLKTQQDLVLWLWDAHNQVNQRLMVEEAASETGDPKYPKLIWPPEQACPNCRLSSTEKSDKMHLDVAWNRTEVYQFLLNFYGQIIRNPIQHDLQSPKSIVHKQYIGEDVAATSAVTVPVGAAVAIAMASVGFGAVACCWRMQQKKRRYNQAYSFKNI